MARIQTLNSHKTKWFLWRRHTDTPSLQRTKEVESSTPDGVPKLGPLGRDGNHPAYCMGATPAVTRLVARRVGTTSVAPLVGTAAVRHSPSLRRTAVRPAALGAPAPRGHRGAGARPRPDRARWAGRVAVVVGTRRERRVVRHPLYRARSVARGQTRVASRARNWQRCLIDTRIGRRVGPDEPLSRVRSPACRADSSPRLPLDASHLR